MYQDPKLHPMKSCVIRDMPKAERKALFRLQTNQVLWSCADWVVRAPQTYYSQRWKEVFAAIVSSKVRKLVLDLNERPSILKHIVHIKFTDLKQLWLHGNDISSLENICFLDCPALNILSLSNNKLSSLTSLAKRNNQFRLLDLENNPGLGIARLSRCGLQKALLQISFDYYRKDIVVGQDASCLVKVGLQKRGSIRINSSRRILQNTVVECLCRKEDECRVFITRP